MNRNPVIILVHEDVLHPLSNSDAAHGSIARKLSPAYYLWFHVFRIPT